MTGRRMDFMLLLCVSVLLAPQPENPGDQNLDEGTQEPEPSTTTPADPASGTQDLISVLCDDVLLRILGLVARADVRQLVRTGAISRRWRNLWKRVPELRLASSTARFKRDRSPERFIAFVDGALALRAQPVGDAVQHLDISLLITSHDHREQIMPPSIAAAERWIRYATQHGVKSFFLALEFPQCVVRGYYRDDDEEGEVAGVISLDDLPGSATLETLRLVLSDARVRLPTSVVFASLVDLELISIVVQGDNSVLSRLFSSACCPRLQKLSVYRVRLIGNMVEQLLLDAPALTDLTLDDMGRGMRSLKLITPRLRVLRVICCLGLKEITVSAARRLEEITFFVVHSLVHFVHGDLSSVSSLGLNLRSHVSGSHDEDRVNDLRLSLLQRSTVARCLDLCLEIPKEHERNIDIIKDRMPQLGQVTSLKLYIFTDGWGWDHHVVADCVAGLLAKFTGLKYLLLHFGYFGSDEQTAELLASGTVSDPVCNHWKSLEFSSAHLEEVEFHGVVGTECELRFLKFLLAGATQLRKVVLRFYETNHTEDEHQRNGGDFLHRLLGHGIWTNCRRLGSLSFEWKAC